MIKREQKWRNKTSGAVVIIEFVSDELVTVLTRSGLLPMLKFIFLQDYEQVGFTCPDCKYEHEQKMAFCANCDILL